MLAQIAREVEHNNAISLHVPIILHREKIVS